MKILLIVFEAVSSQQENHFVKGSSSKTIVLSLIIHGTLSALYEICTVEYCDPMHHLQQGALIPDITYSGESVVLQFEPNLENHTNKLVPEISDKQKTKVVNLINCLFQ